MVDHTKASAESLACNPRIVEFGMGEQRRVVYRKVKHTLLSLLGNKSNHILLRIVEQNAAPIGSRVVSSIGQRRDSINVLPGVRMQTGRVQAADVHGSTVAKDAIDVELVVQGRTVPTFRIKGDGTKAFLIPRHTEAPCKMIAF